MPAMRREVRFYFDFISPYAYLAWTRMPGIAERFGIDLAPVPVLFAGLLNAHGTKGPAEVPARRRYLIKDAARKAATFGVELHAPFAHPFNPLLLLRIASLPVEEAERRRAIDVFYQAAWVSRTDIQSTEAVKGLLASAGLDPGWTEQAGSAESKDRVRSQTDEAIRLGVFGVPTAIVEGEMFWGTDSLADLERYLEGKDPVPKDLIERWESLPSAAHRPQSRAG